MNKLVVMFGAFLLYVSAWLNLAGTKLFKQSAKNVKQSVIVRQLPDNFGVCNLYNTKAASLGIKGVLN